MKVRQLFSSEKKWTQGLYAKDIKGLACGVSQDKAYSFCLDGALTRCYGPSGKYYEIRKQVDDVIRKMTRGRFSGAVSWNDHNRRTFVQVKDLVKRLDI